jgi:nucleoside-diphosphate-sugar epimerase
MKTAFVTGGSGFLGRALIAHLVKRNVAVRALARSEGASKTVRKLGATVVEGDLAGGERVRAAMEGCDVLFHSAAFTEDWGDEKLAFAITVEGTETMLEHARQAGIARFVHVGTEAALMDGKPLVNVNEERPLPASPIGLYPRTKAEAERRVLRANGPSFATLVARPRFIWGDGDTSLLPRLIESSKNGSLKWIGGGHYLTSTCHVDNACEGLIKIAERGAPGQIYFLTDGKPVEFRWIVSALLETQGVKPPSASIPKWLACGFSWTTDAVWRRLHLRGRPPLPYGSFLLIGQEVTVDDSKARRELGYEGKVTMDEGLARMRH